MADKRTLCLDFDGVIHSYTSGWLGVAVIPDPPVPGAIAFMREAVKHFRVVVLSSRSHQEGGRRAMNEWLHRYAVKDQLHADDDLSWASEIEFVTEKPAAFVTLDDRAMTFDGTWPTMPQLLSFRTWMQEAGFRKDLESLLNRNSRENGSDTPDFILASYLAECLAAWDKATQARERWYGRPAGDGAAIHGGGVTPA